MKIDPQKYKLVQEISAGGIVYKKEGKNIKIAIIEREAMKDRTIPKGHQDPGESLQETAIREVVEETGFSSIVEQYLGKFTYSVKNDNKKIFSIRTVHWFLMNYSNGDKMKGNEEVKKVKWVPIDFNLSQMSHNNDKMILTRAIKRLRRLK